MRFEKKGSQLFPSVNCLPEKVENWLKKYNKNLLLNNKKFATFNMQYVINEHVKTEKYKI